MSEIQRYGYENIPGEGRAFVPLRNGLYVTHADHAAEIAAKDEEIASLRAKAYCAENIEEIIKTKNRYAAELDKQDEEIARFKQALATANQEFWKKHDQLVATQQQYAELQATLASTEEMLEAQQLKYDGCPHKPIDNNTCGCSLDRIGDVCAFHAPSLRQAQATLAAEISRQKDRIAQCEQQAQRIAELEGKLVEADRRITAMGQTTRS